MGIFWPPANCCGSHQTMFSVSIARIALVAFSYAGCSSFVYDALQPALRQAVYSRPIHGSLMRS